MIPISVIGGSDGILQMAKRTHQNIDEFDQQEIFMWVLQQMESNSEQVFLYVMIFYAVHTLCCIVMIVGAFKVSLPFNNVRLSTLNDEIFTDSSIFACSLHYLGIC